MCHNTCCWSLSTYMLDLLWVCSFHLFDRKLQHWFYTWRRWTWEGCWKLRNPCVWSLWPEALPEKDESASSFTDRACPPKWGMALLSVCCQGKKNTPLPLSGGPRGGGKGVSLCLLSFVAWEAQKRKVCLGRRSLAAWSVGDECLASWRCSSCVWGG